MHYLLNLSTDGQYVVFNKIYFKMCNEDLEAAIILSQIMRWYKDPEQFIILDGRNAIVKQRDEWIKECCITPKKYDRAIGVLKNIGFIYTELHRSELHDHNLAVFIFVNEYIFGKIWKEKFHSSLGDDHG